MQFYLIAPAVLAACRLLRNKSVVLLVILAVLSKMFEIMQPSEKHKFYLIQGRLWQFILGIVAYVKKTSIPQKQPINHTVEFQPLKEHFDQEATNHTGSYVCASKAS